MNSAGEIIENSIPRVGVGGVELNYELLDPEESTLASQDKLKVSLGGLPFAT